MEGELFSHLKHSNQIGYAYHQIVKDPKGNVIDYVFLEVNEGFEKFTGLKKENILNKRITDVIPQIVNDKFNWIEFYGEIALNGGSNNLEQYSHSLDKWYKIEVFSSKKNYFTTLFTDSSEKQKQIDQNNVLYKITKELLDIEDEEIPYQKVIDTLSHLSGAKYGVFNIYSADGTSFTNMAFSGAQKNWAKVTKLLGFDLKGKTWETSPNRVSEIKGGKLVKFDNLRQIANEVLPDSLCLLIEKAFNLGLIYVIEINYKNKTIGDILILFEKGKDIQNQSLVSSIANIVGVALNRQSAKNNLVTERNKLNETNLFYNHVLESIQDGISILSPDLNVLKTNSKIAEWFPDKRNPVGEKCYNVYQNRSQPCTNCPVITSLKSGKPEMNIISGPYGDKSRYFELYAYPMKSPDSGEIIAIIELLRDITDKYNNQKELEIRETNFKNIFNSHIDFHWILDKNGIILDVNETVVKRLGYSKEELKGKSVLIVHPSKKQKEANKIIEKMLEYQKDYFSIPLCTKFKEQIPVETYIWNGFWNMQEVIFGVSKDISALKFSEEKFATAFTNNPAISGISDLETGEYIEVNDAFYEKLGYIKEEVLGKKENTLLKLDTDFRKRAIQELKEKGKVKNLETVLYSKDNSVLDILISAQLIEIQNKFYNYTTAIDITDRKNAERELEKERSLFAEGPVVSIIWDPKEGWPVKFVSANITSLLGYSTEEFLSEKFRFANLIHPDDIQKVGNEVEIYINSKTKYFEQSYRLKNKNGDYIWIYDFTHLIFNAQNELIEIIGYIFDETQLKNTEQALENKKTRLANIIDGTNVGTWEWNVQTGETIFNEKWANIIGYDLEEISPTTIKTWEEYAHPEDLKNSYRNLERHFKGDKEYYELECRMLHKKGHWVWVLDRGKVISWTSDGKPEWMFGTHWEITDRKNAESALFKQVDKYSELNKEYIKVNEELIKAKNKAEESDRLKSAFLANMSHEIRTPMNAIVGFASFLLDKDFSEDEKELYANTIIKNGNHLLKLINDIIDVSKVDAGKVSIVKSQLNVNDLLNEMHSFFKAQLYNNEICHLELKTNISKQKCIINTDETRLRQILINLINNAIKFTKKGLIEFGYKDMKNHLLFHIKDTGIGIKKENHQKIFNRFLQASDETEKLYGGTGLGLPIVKAYINLLGGEIWVESEPDKGSTFYFTISKK